jgi:hypothetical protein
VIEVAFNGPDVHIRDSKHPGQAPLVFSREEFAAFTATLARGEPNPEPARALDPADPHDMVLILLKAAADGDVRENDCGNIDWHHDGAVTDVTDHVAGMRTAELLYQSLHSHLWRPTRAGREAIDRSGV